MVIFKEPLNNVVLMGMTVYTLETVFWSPQSKDSLQYLCLPLFPISQHAEANRSESVQLLEVVK